MLTALNHLHMYSSQTDGESLMKTFLKINYATEQAA